MHELSPVLSQIMHLNVCESTRSQVLDVSARHEINIQATTINHNKAGTYSSRDGT